MGFLIIYTLTGSRRESSAQCVRHIVCGSLPAGSAPAAGPAGGAVAATGGFARLFVADHAADQEADDERDHGDQRDVDEIGGEPREHKITSFRMRGSTVREEVLPAPRCH